MCEQVVDGADGRKLCAIFRALEDAYHRPQILVLLQVTHSDASIHFLLSLYAREGKMAYPSHDGAACSVIGKVLERTHGSVLCVNIPIAQHKHEWLDQLGAPKRVYL